LADTIREISETELTEMMLDLDVPDHEIARYLIVESTREGAFAPNLIPNPNLVESSILEGGGIIQNVNRFSRWRRSRAYKRKIKNWDGPRLVSEGDSWFQYPFLLDDVIDQLDEHYAIRSLGAAGDLISDIVAQDELISTVALERPDGVLISGGGNDLLGKGRLAKALRKFEPGLSPEDYLTDNFYQKLSEVIGGYQSVLFRLTRSFPRIPVFVHGYDHARPSRGPWLGRPMEKLEIFDQGLQQALVALMVDKFYDALQQMLLQPSLAGQVRLVDCRGLVASDWHDELHPTNSGYNRVAEQFHKVISNKSALESGQEVLVDRPSIGIQNAAEAAVSLSRMANEDMLIAELGRRATLASADPENSHALEFVGTISALEGPVDGFLSVGKRILRRLNAELHNLICGDEPDNAEDREKLKNALGFGDAAVAAALVQFLVGSFGLLPAVATVIAAILLKYFLKPTLEEICSAWGEGLGA